ncbi:radical SAM peptide maturase [Parabacteroides pacaensis]|uniref:radical SAM peptide maturase n=1 Tax=Parabacteroides pacaensis TaxID=2086575 RepID=UPI00131BA8A5|nr:radical SAM peptide maturase [Parabacteroides pacaensis]
MYDFKLRSYTLSHPLLKLCYDLEQDTGLPSSYSELIEMKPEIAHYYEQEDIKYYFHKYHHLKSCGYFSKMEKKNEWKLAPVEIENAICNMRNLVFEVTDACNLACKYCGYGELYYDYDPRKNHYMTFQTVKNILDYLIPFWKSVKNKSANRIMFIGFYGGEPLLNFKLIKDTVEYIKTLNIPGRKIKYTMTTNATLLHKYIDFLAENDFKIVISLDGTERNHSYRTYHNGQNSYQKVFSNIKIIQDKYAAFFQKNVSFNSVLHNRNSVESINGFIKREFNKIPKISSLNNSGIKKEKMQEFNKLYNDYVVSINSASSKEEIIKDRFIEDSNIFNLCLFLYWYGNNQFDSYKDLFNRNLTCENISTGTCLPFERKMFITVNNKILACERISQSYVLGKIVDEKVCIDYQSIADMYNQFFDNIYHLCRKCYRSGKCSQCILQLEDLTENVQCMGFQNKKQFEFTISRYISILESYPYVLPKYMKEVVLK